MSAQNTYDIAAFLLCFCSISYSNKCGYRSISDIWFLVHYRLLRKAVLIVAKVSRQYLRQSGRKNVSTFNSYVATKAEKSIWKRMIGRKRDV